MTQLRVFLTRSVVTISSDTSIDDAIGLLERHQVRHLPVIRGGRPVGMLSLGDVLSAVGGLLSGERVSNDDASVSHAGPTGVEQIMAPEVVTLSPDESLAAAASLMLERQIAAVIAATNDRIFGIVTELDCLRHFCDDDTATLAECRQHPVSEYMSTEVVTTVPSEKVFALIRKMGNRIHHLPVLENGELVGILSDHDVNRALALDRIKQITHPEQRIQLMEGYDARRIMSQEVVTTTPTAPLVTAAEQMIEHKIGALPVIDAGELVGIITETDILRACVGALGDPT